MRQEPERQENPRSGFSERVKPEYGRASRKICFNKIVY